MVVWTAGLTVAWVRVAIEAGKVYYQTNRIVCLDIMAVFQIVGKMK